MKAMITDIQRFCLHDGPGVRTTVFFKGCNLHCPWCHNPETQAFGPEEFFFKDKCVNIGRCRSGLPCPVGARVTTGCEITAPELLSEILKDRAFYKNGGGVTFSGGEALLQADFLCEITAACKANGLHVCVDTALNVPQEVWRDVTENVDIFLVDIKGIGEEKCGVTGCDPVFLEKNLVFLSDQKKEIWIRIPVVEGYNDDPEEGRRMAALIGKCSSISRIDTLPVLPGGRRKSEGLGREVSEKWFSKNPEAAAERFAELLSTCTGRKVGTYL